MKAVFSTLSPVEMAVLVAEPLIMVWYITALLASIICPSPSSINLPRSAFPLVEMKLSLWLPISVLLQPVISVYVLLPLYIYPYDDAGTFLWQPVIKAVAAHPHVQWQIIINPDSGPGSSKYPDSQYITAVSKLHKYSNVKMIGYVDTAYTRQKITEVQKQISLYAGWAKHTRENITLSGIFFDDVDDAASAAPYMKTVSQAARSAFPKSHGGSVTFNPGTNDSPISYYDYADTVVNFESSLADYNNAKTISTFPPKHRSREAIIANNGKPTAAALQTFVKQAISSSIGGIYITSDCCYQAVNATLLNAMVGDIATAQAQKSKRKLILWFA